MADEVRVRGRIVEGLGVGGKYVAHPYYMSVFTAILGCKPYPGTLNIRADIDWRELAAKCVPEVINEVYWDGVRLGAVYVWRAKLAIDLNVRPPTVLIRPLLSRHESNVVELVSCSRLRDLLRSDHVEVIVLCRRNPDYTRSPRLP